MARLAIALVLALASSLPVAAFAETPDGGDGGAGDASPAEPATRPTQALDGGTRPEPDAAPPVQSPANATPPPFAPIDPPVVAPIDPPLEAPIEGATGKKSFTGIKGKLTDSTTGEALIEASVQLAPPLSGASDAHGPTPAPPGRPKRALSDVDGNYSLKLPPGTYDLRVFYELYKGRRISGVEVKAGETTRLDVKLDPDGKSVQEVVVEAKADTTTAAVGQMRRQKAATVSDAVSAEQIARSPDSNASDAAKRVVGVTIENDKYVIVRGLSGRYSIALLNNVPLPSPDPDLPAVPLDMFPASVLANLTVSKSFVPDLPGNFVGGALNVETRSFPTKFTLNVQLKTMGDSASTFQQGRGYRGGAVDALGFDDGTRALPFLITRRSLLPSPPLQSDDQIPQARSWSNNWVLNQRLIPPGLGLTFAAGNTFKAGNHKIGLNASLNYNLAATHQIKSISAVGESDGMGGYLPSPLKITNDESIERSTLGGLLALGWMPKQGQQINFTGIYSHNTENAAEFSTGKDINEAIIQRTRMRFTERSMIATQLVGEHELGRSMFQLGWQGNFARVSQDEPDTRDLLRAELPDGGYVIGNQSGQANRLFTNLEDLQGGGGADLAIALRPLKVKFGGSYLHAVRDYQARRFEFRANQSTSLLPPEEAFATDNLGTKVKMGEATLASDGVGSQRGIGAAFAMIDITALRQVRFLAGARVEVSNLDVNSRSKLKPSADDCAALPECVPERFDAVHRQDIDVLPAASVVGHLTDSMNLRLAYGMTLSRPNFRELSPAIYYDYIRRRAVSGDPKLEPSKTQSADLRYEWFFGQSELLGASLFYKYMDRPIERFISDATQGNVFYANTDYAHVFGGELEGRFSFGRLYKPLADLTFGGNLSLIYSEVTYTPAGSMTSAPKRPLQGQSPYTFNFDISYHYVPKGTRITLLYNVFGPRITEIGTMGLANIFDEPVHRLDLVFAQKLPARLRLKLAATNLLNSPVRQTQNGVEILAYETGVGLSATLELNLE